MANRPGGAGSARPAWCDAGSPRDPLGEETRRGPSRLRSAGLGLIVASSASLLMAVAWGDEAVYLPATIGGAATTVVAIQVFSFIHLGYLDPFFEIAALITSLVSLLVSLLVGLPFRKARGRSRGQPRV